MTHSPLASEIHDTFQKSSRLGATIDTILWNHMAGTDARATLAQMKTGSRTVSSNAIITNEGEIWVPVGEEWRAYTSGDPHDGGKGAAWDRRAITVEIENETGAPEWRISEKAIQAAAAFRNDIYSRYRIVNEFGHRELWERFRASYPTYCPGPQTVARIVAAAGGNPVAAGASTPPVLVGGVTVDRSIRDIQALVGAVVDGAYGAETTAKVKAWQAANGLVADGWWGPKSDAKGFGSKPVGGLVVDGVWGVLTTRALQRGLGVTDDGQIGPRTIAALQRRLGVSADGILGPVTRKALQRHLGVAQDGVWGPVTARALQTRLNAGTF